MAVAPSQISAETLRDFRNDFILVEPFKLVEGNPMSARKVVSNKYSHQQVGNRWTGTVTLTTIAHAWEDSMAKGYWVTFYPSVSNPTALAEYAKLAGPVIQAGGGRFLARGEPAKTYEAATNQRVVVIEFDSVERAIATHDSDAYKPALRTLEGAVVRDVRIIEGVA